MFCSSCNAAFASNKLMQQHMKGKRHIDKMNGTTPCILHHSCECGKSYSHRQGLYVHRQTCTHCLVTCTPPVTETSETPAQEEQQEISLHTHKLSCSIVKPTTTPSVTKKNTELDSMKENLQRQMAEMKQDFEKEIIHVKNTLKKEINNIKNKFEKEIQKNKTTNPPPKRRKKINKDTRQSI